MIIVNNLNVKLDDELIIKDLSLRFDKKINVIVGKSGCGKTQFLNQIINKNKSIVSDNTHYGYLSQNLDLLDWYTVYKNLELVCTNKSEIDKLLKEFGLYEYKDKYINELSGGQKSKVGFLRAYIMAEKYIILDEPFSSLDYITHYEVLNWVKEIIKNTNKHLILVTHNLDEAVELANKVFILKLPGILSATLEDKEITKNNIIINL